jgi:flagellar hook-basal body complex protein FliE
MSIEAIAALNALSATDTLRLAQLQPVPSTFDTLVSRVSGINEQMQANAQALQSVALGETDNLHQVMMNLERTKLDFDLLLAVRNKVLDAYQELMRMQI